MHSANFNVRTCDVVVRNRAWISTMLKECLVSSTNSEVVDREIALLRNMPI